MKRQFYGIAMMLAALPALAEEAAPPPRIEADPTALIVSAVLFVGMIGGFFFYVWWKDKAASKQGGEE